MSSTPQVLLSSDTLVVMVAYSLPAPPHASNSSCGSPDSSGPEKSSLWLCLTVDVDGFVPNDDGKGSQLRE